MIRVIYQYDVPFLLKGKKLIVKFFWNMWGRAPATMYVDLEH